MNPRNARILDDFRGKALARNIPAPDVERWMELVRPSALLTPDGDGPVVGRFGGPVPLPADVETQQYPLVATIDCAALPREATDLPLPSDGRLLFFGCPEEHGSCMCRKARPSRNESWILRPIRPAARTSRRSATKSPTPRRWPRCGPTGGAERTWSWADAVRTATGARDLVARRFGRTQVLVDWNL
ncbi:DUF1963 domain-containing protein [Lentzea flaviverrucosa]|uniref:DUF1963 domain-containing protein n=1 Tax=Lentzea flaviverrucosa TaxID=200379 RepID=UPI001160D8AD|nr:DUF1963 domain-containing protein [Lentzea flaviverrucosa]